MQEPNEDSPVPFQNQTEAVVAYPDPIVSLTASQLLDILYLLKAPRLLKPAYRVPDPLLEPPVSCPLQIFDKAPKVRHDVLFQVALQNTIKRPIVLGLLPLLCPAFNVVPGHYGTYQDYHSDKSTSECPKER